MPNVDAVFQRLKLLEKERDLLRKARNFQQEEFLCNLEWIQFILH